MLGTVLEGGVKSYRIYFGVNAISTLSRELGKSIDKLGGGDFPLDDLRKAMWVGLQYGERNKKITEEQAGDIMDDIIAANDFNYLSEKLAEAMGATFKSSSKAENEGEQDSKTGK